MTDLQTLHDAFTELERRADAAVPAALPRPRRARGFRLVPIVATMAAVAALAAGAVWVAPGDPPVSGSTTVTNIPRTPDELAAKLKAVLGDMATFEVTESSVDEDTLGMSIQGTLTADGVTGGFGLRVYVGPTEPVTCSPARAGCFVSLEWAVDNTTAVVEMRGTEPYGVVYGGYRALPGDMNVVLRVSNERYTDGSSEVLAPQPPLELPQLASVLNAW